MVPEGSWEPQRSHMKGQRLWPKAEKLQNERLLTRPKRDQESSKKANENPAEQVTDSSTEEENEV